MAITFRTFPIGHRANEKVNGTHRLIPEYITPETWVVVLKNKRFTLVTVVRNVSLTSKKSTIPQGQFSATDNA